MLASGATATQSIENDDLNAEKIGKEQKEKSIQERLQTHEKNFFDPIKQNKLKTMSHSSKKVKLKSASNKVIELKHQGIIAFQLLIKSR